MVFLFSARFHSFMPEKNILFMSDILRSCGKFEQLYPIEIVPSCQITSLFEHTFLNLELSIGSLAATVFYS